MATFIEDADQDTKVQTEESADEDHIRFDTGGTERMVIADDGDVTFNSMLVHQAGQWGSPIWTMTNGLSLRAQMQLDWNSKTFRLTTTDFNGSPTDVDFAFFKQDGSAPYTIHELMRITQDGKVGIGTDSPSEALEVDGNIKITGNGTALYDGELQIKSAADASLKLYSGGNIKSYFNYYSSTNSALLYHGDSNGDLLVSSAGNLRLRHNTNDALVVDSSSDVTISNNLDVSGDLEVTGDIIGNISGDTEIDGDLTVTGQINGVSVVAGAVENIVTAPAKHSSFRAGVDSDYIEMWTSGASARLQTSNNALTLSCGFGSISFLSGLNFNLISNAPITFTANSDDRLIIDSSGNTNVKHDLIVDGDLSVAGSLNAKADMPIGSLFFLASSNGLGGDLAARTEKIGDHANDTIVWNLAGDWYIANGQVTGVPNMLNAFPRMEAAAGSTGGQDSVVLTQAHLPYHDHGGSTLAGTGAHKHALRGFGNSYSGICCSYARSDSRAVGGGDGNQTVLGYYYNDGQNNQLVSDEPHIHTISGAGHDNAHENMPVYYSLIPVYRKA